MLVLELEGGPEAVLVVRLRRPSEQTIRVRLAGLIQENVVEFVGRFTSEVSVRAITCGSGGSTRRRSAGTTAVGAPESPTGTTSASPSTTATWPGQARSGLVRAAPAPGRGRTARVSVCRTTRLPAAPGRAARRGIADRGPDHPPPGHLHRWLSPDRAVTGNTWPISQPGRCSSRISVNEQPGTSEDRPLRRHRRAPPWERARVANPLARKFTHAEEDSWCPAVRTQGKSNS